jgi:cathepsin A (carboxypeptidase C)
VNAGFSYTTGKPVSSTEDAAQDVYAFLQLFLTKYKKYSKLPFHVTGESYAGHYIPAIVKEIADNNNAIEPGNQDVLPIQLSSIAIGNGLTDPLVQYQYYPEMACRSSCKSFVGFIHLFRWLCIG